MKLTRHMSKLSVGTNQAQISADNLSIHRPLVMKIKCVVNKGGLYNYYLYNKRKENEKSLSWLNIQHLLSLLSSLGAVYLQDYIWQKAHSPAPCRYRQCHHYSTHRRRLHPVHVLDNNEVFSSSVLLDDSFSGFLLLLFGKLVLLAVIFSEFRFRFILKHRGKIAGYIIVAIYDHCFFSGE